MNARTRISAIAAVAALLLAALPISGARAQPTWAQTGAMNFARYGHDAVRLLDGRVLVIGGTASVNGSRPDLVSTAEIYDPKTGSWSKTGDVVRPRVGPTVTRLADGRVLITGGWTLDLAVTKTAEIFDPATGAFAATSDMSATREYHTASLMRDGRVLIAGGLGLGDIPPFGEIFDPATGRFTPTDALPVPRYGHAATTLDDGKVIIAGGLVPDPAMPDFGVVHVSRVDLFDPATNAWVHATDMNAPRAGASAFKLPSGKVLVLGGGESTASTGELYDSAAGRWTAVGAGPLSLSNPVLQPDGQVLVEGGLDGVSTIALPDARLFDPTTGVSRTTASMHQGRAGHSTTLLPDGTVLVAGGFLQIDSATGSGARRDAEIYRGATTGGTIGPGFTGAWYDPAQSGHGLFIEVLPDNRILAAWFTFAPGGEQSWFYGVGTYTGNAATIAAVDQPTGGRWIPNFDPAKIVHNAWGSLTLTFSDCDHGRVDFSSASAYGSGSMSLTRLTQPAGLTCP